MARAFWDNFIQIQSCKTEHCFHLHMTLRTRAGNFKAIDPDLVHVIRRGDDHLNQSNG